jgi:c-di-GMP-binding flagellar brake protein YcgR
VERVTVRGALYDLSLGGALFVPAGSAAINAGSHGRLHLLAGTHPRPQVRVARVADVQTSSVPAVRGVGIEFLHLSHADRDALNHLLAGAWPLEA